MDIHNERKRLTHCSLSQRTGWYGLLLLLALPLPLLAEVQQDPASDLMNSVRHYLESSFANESDVEIELPQLDKRMRIATCSQPLVITHTGNEIRPGNLTLHVRCQAEQPWQLYVRAVVRVYRHVLVLGGALPRGAALDTGSIHEERREISHLHGRYLTDYNRVLGQTLRNNMAAGSLLQQESLVAPKMIRKGEQITIRTAHPQIDVGAPGIALSDGELGQNITARNVRSGHVVQGRVVSPGIIEVAF